MMHGMQHEGGGPARGPAALLLADNVVLLDPEAAVFNAMLEGWQRQQQSRVLQATTIAGRAGVVRRLATFCNLYPWQWSAEEVEAFFAGLQSGSRPLAPSTMRNCRVGSWRGGVGSVVGPEAFMPVVSRRVVPLQ